MPFCTACGKQNPDDARFCAQCGTKLLGGEDTGATPVEPGQPSPVESTATITFGAPDQRESSDRQLSPVDAAAVDALPEGHALLVVQRGPSAGSRFLLDTEVGSLNGTYVNRDRIDSVALNDGDEVQIGKYRLVFFSSHPES